MSTKPYHLMTPSERTAQRIAQNREIEQRISQALTEKQTKRGRKPKASSTVSTGGTKSEVNSMFLVTRSNRWGKA